MTQHKDQMRAEFEVAYLATFNTEGYEQSEIEDLRKDTFSRWPNDEYLYSSVKHAFLGWKLARASAPQGVPSEPSDEDIDAVFNAMPDGAHGWLITWGYRQFARALLQRWGGHGLTDDLVWCDCGDGYAKGTDEAIHIASGEGCSNCLAGTKPEPAAACHITLPPAPHKLGDVELWPRSVIEQHVADLEQAVRYGADLFQQAEQDWRKDAERYQALKQRFACIDFKYDFGSGKDSTVLCFDFGVDQTAPFFAGLDANVDAAIAAQKGQA